MKINKSLSTNEYILLIYSLAVESAKEYFDSCPSDETAFYNAHLKELQEKDKFWSKFRKPWHRPSDDVDAEERFKDAYNSSINFCKPLPEGYRRTFFDYCTKFNGDYFTAKLSVQDSLTATGLYGVFFPREEEEYEPDFDWEAEEEAEYQDYLYWLEHREDELEGLQ